MTDKLEACPFCGVVPQMQNHTQEDEMDEGRYVFFVECGNRKCPMGLVSTGGPYKESAKAAERWNSRTLVAAPPPDDDLISRADAVAAIEKNYIDLGPQGSSRYEKGGAFNDGISASVSAIERLAAPSPVAATVDAETDDHDACSHWREGDSDNCVWCGDDLGPTTEADVATAAPSDSSIRAAAEEIRELCDKEAPEIPGDSTSYAPSTDDIAAILSKHLHPVNNLCFPKPCVHCNQIDCKCSDFDVSPDMGAKG